MARFMQIIRQLFKAFFFLQFLTVAFIAILCLPIPFLLGILATASIQEAQPLSYLFREIYFSFPRQFWLMPLLTITSIALLASALLDFHEKHQKAFVNLGKFCFAVTLLVFTQSIYAACLQSFFSIAGYSLDAPFDISEIIKRFFQSEEALIELTVFLAGYLFIYRGQPITSSFSFASRGNKIILIVCALFYMGVGATYTFASVQTRILNPGLNQIYQHTNFPLFGIKQASRYRWRIPHPLTVPPSGVVKGTLVDLADSFTVILVRQSKESSDTLERFKKRAQAQSQTIKAQRLTQGTLWGYEAELPEQEDTKSGIYLWQTGQGTDIQFFGITTTSVHWDEMIQQITANLEIYR